ncbi:MAG: peptidase T [Mariniphaga sp.]|nr:peptidase T [Mariniphaga sp.]MDD4424615.1 peptidase T [Mariniphaga sp.]
MSEMIREKVTERFIRFAKDNTTSDPESKSWPSTERQRDFMIKLKAELQEIGLTDVDLDENGYLMATVPENTGSDSPVVGFIAHVDTSPDFEGNRVNPQFTRNYNGKIIHLKDGVSIDPAEFPELLQYKGQDIITSDGTTLLGADDKAGVAAIVTAAEFLIHDLKKRKHGRIRIGFTPDEEIGRGADKFDVKKFGVDFAYTLDGGEIGELEYENFNAAGARISIRGRSVHPGMAKNKMVNALLIANRIISMLPPAQRPEHTEKYEGFFHLTSLSGSVESAEMQFIIRDHDRFKFEEKKRLLKEVVQLMNLEVGKELVHIVMQDQYYNMKQQIEPVMHVIEIARNAMRLAGIEPKVKAIRGGTDGAKLSYNGLPCPNIFAGGHNFHGPYEFLPIPSLVKAVEVILNIAELAVSENWKTK